MRTGWPRHHHNKPRSNLRILDGSLQIQAGSEEPWHESLSARLFLLFAKHSLILLRSDSDLRCGSTLAACLFKFFSNHFVSICGPNHVGLHRCVRMFAVLQKSLRHGPNGAAGVSYAHRAFPGFSATASRSNCQRAASHPRRKTSSEGRLGDGWLLALSRQRGNLDMSAIFMAEMG